MIFSPLELSGAYVIVPELVEDDRGFFARVWCQREFRERGLNPNLVQCNISYNKHKGTLRGMHFQASPHEECKLIRCTKGRIFDVIIDLRDYSPTFKQSYGAELSAENQKMLYAPGGFAHGFLTLEDDTEVFYQMSQYYEPTAARGIRWNDPAFNIEWPGNVLVVKERDQNYQDFNP